MIETIALRKEYSVSGRRTTALDGVDLSVAAGEVFGVLGASGAGKSTLLRCVNLLERPTSGTVRVAGEELTALGQAELRAARRRIGMIFQHFNLLSSRTVAANVALPLEISGTGTRRERAARVAELLDLVGLADKAKAYPATLSGGQRQRVAIARALADHPRVLLSDEATSALDTDTTRSILALLRRLGADLGLTILLITHELDVVRTVCDSAAVLAGGRVVESGTVPELLARPDSVLGAQAFALPDAAGGGSPDGRVVRLAFTGHADGQAALGELARRYEVAVRLLAGTVQTVGGRRPVGRLDVALDGPADRIDAGLAWLADHGLAVLPDGAGPDVPATAEVAR
jgi:D-methionine transport system ATP-binding protein